MSRAVKLKRIDEKKQLHDGFEDDHYYGLFAISSGNYNIQFKVTNLISASVAEKDAYHASILNAVIQEMPLIKRLELLPGFVTYKNEFGIPIYLHLQEQCVAIIACGETQPARYQIFLEGLFLIV